MDSPKRREGCCQPNCMLKHFVSINYSGKTVLVFGGIFLMTYPGASQAAVFIGGANAIMMSLGQIWYTAYWNVWGGVDDFADNVEDGHPLLRNHRWLCNSGLAAMWWIFAAVWYYVAYAVAFGACALVGEPVPLVQSYVTAAALWHVWCAVLLLLTTVSQCSDGGGGGAYQRVSPKESLVVARLPL